MPSAFDRGMERILGMLVEDDLRPKDSLLLPPGIFSDAEKRGLNMVNCMVNGGVVDESNNKQITFVALGET